MNWEQTGTFALPFLAWMAGIQFRSLVLLALTGMALFYLRRSSAAMRHLALSLAVLGLFALPLLPLFLPAWSVASLSHATLRLPLRAHLAEDAVPSARRSGNTPAMTPSVAQSLAPNYQGATAGPTSEPTTAPSSLPPVVPILATVLFLNWILGTALLLLRLVLGIRRLQQIAQRAESATSAAPLLAEELSVLSLSLKMRQSVRLLIAASETPGLSPMTWGLARPVVLLPAEASLCPLDCLRPVLLHELAHIKRGDWTTELLARVVCALYWPNPFVWLLVRRLQNESESACDDRVILAGIASTDYAQQLIEVARRLKAQREQVLFSSVAVRMAHNSTVEGRVRAILSGDRCRRPTSVRAVVLALVGGTILLLPLANLRIALAGGQENSTENTSLRVGETTWFNGALPLGRRLARTKPNMTLEEYRTIAATRFAPGSERFPNGLVAEGLYVSGVQSDGSVASWDRTGKLLARGPNWKGSGLKAGELRFQIDRLKLPGMPEWIAKPTFDRLSRTRALETGFGVVGEPAGYFGRPGGTDYGNGYHNFSESHVWKLRQAAKVDLYLTTSYGPWQPLVTNGMLPLTTRRNGVEAESVVHIPARFFARDASGQRLWCLRLETVDAGGNVVGSPRIAQYNETTLGSRVVRVRFRFLTSELPLAKVASVRLLARPKQTLYFRNVPTRPEGLPRVPVKSQ